MISSKRARPGASGPAERPDTARPGPWVPDGRPEHLRQACDGSLARLRLDRIDLYQFHRPDPRVPVAESMPVALWEPSL